MIKQSIKKSLLDDLAKPFKYDVEKCPGMVLELRKLAENLGFQI
jgi:hypothetical protein